MNAMRPYPVICRTPGCEAPAEFKIAARWSDGITHELKSYGMACAGCVAALFTIAREKQQRCRLAVGETLDPPGIYEHRPATLDQHLVRRFDLESTVPASTGKEGEIRDRE